MTKDEATALALKIIGLPAAPGPSGLRKRIFDEDVIESVRAGATSLEELAVRLGLSKAAVAVRAKALVMQGRLESHTQQTGKRGRPGFRFHVPEGG